VLYPGWRLRRRQVARQAMRLECDEANGIYILGR
jgi:hypothetical protein